MKGWGGSACRGGSRSGRFCPVLLASRREPGPRVGRWAGGDYRHYFAELARKPQALRQVAPELFAELGEPYGRLWTLLEGERGGHEAARALARLLRAVDEHGEERVRGMLEQVLTGGTFDELAVQRLLTAAQDPQAVTVPEALRGYEAPPLRPLVRCSASTAPTCRTTAARLGKMPTTLVRRRISLLRRSSGLFDQTCRQCWAGKAVNARTSGPASASSAAASGSAQRAAPARGRAGPAPRPPRTARRSSAPSSPPASRRSSAPG